MKLPSKSSPAAVHLDAIRGIAALLVALSHLRAYLWVDFSELEHPNIVSRLVYLISGLGHQSVMVFFVLSGYFIAGSVLSGLKSDRFSPAKYAIARLSRLYVVLVPALLFGGLLDVAGLSMFSASRVYSEIGYGHMVQEPLSNSLTLPAFLGSLFFLQKILVPCAGSNGPLWSLANEFWYYAIFPLLALCWLGRLSVVRKSLLFLAASLILVFVRIEIATYFLVWLMGAFIAWLPEEETLKNKAAMYGSALLFSLVFLGSKVFKLPGRVGDFAIALTFASLLYSVLRSPLKSTRSGYARISEFLSGISYTLYLTHVPVLVFFAAVVIGTGRQLGPDLKGYAVGFAALLVILVYGTSMWFLFERNTGHVRSWLESRLLGSRPMRE